MSGQLFSEFFRRTKCMARNGRWRLRGGAAVVCGAVSFASRVHGILTSAKSGFPGILAARQKMRRHARKIDVVLAPFFPGYLFVQLDLQRDQWRSVNGTYGLGGW